MWRPEKYVEIPSYIVFHNATVASSGELFYKDYDRQVVIPKSTRLREVLFSEDTEKSVRKFKRCEHYVFSGYNLQPIWNVRSFLSGSDWATMTNPVPGSWFLDIVKGMPGGSMVSARIGTFEDLKGTQPLLYNGGVSINRVVDPYNLGGLIAMGMNAILPSIKREMSLINSVIELKDFTSLPKLMRAIEGLKIVRKKKTKVNFRSTVAKMPMVRIAKLVADGFLQWNFNVAPLLSDITALHGAVTAVSRELDKLAAKAGRKRVGHWSAPLTDSYINSDDVVDVEYREGSLVDSYGLRKITVYIQPRFTLTVAYDFKSPDLNRKLLERQALWDKLGLNLDPSVLWNALPWSFVVDWVLNVSSFLHSLRTSHVKFDSRVYDACWSMKADRHIRLVGRLNYQQVELRRVYESAYKRVPLTMSDAFRGIRTSGLSGKELSLAAALGIGRL